ncbi:MAG TPA: DUF1697 domain-containing protein [Solirubrobacterales bacterium]|nr:DUF1697 domain-containing protein [Solirubrobacterales bacterium]
MAAGVQYLALLRGVNVGGKNLVRMAELRAAFEDLGLDEVATYIQSGNVLFRAPRQPAEKLSARLETELTNRFGIELKLVLLTHTQMRAVIDGAPAGYGGPDYRCDVLFLRKPLTVKRAFAALEMKEGVDQAWPGRGVVYFARLDAKASSSRINRIVMKAEYQNMTLRSWSTTTKLAGLLGISRSG